MKYTCNDSDEKIRYVIFDEELWLCWKHYSDLQKNILNHNRSKNVNISYGESSRNILFVLLIMPFIQFLLL